MNSVNIIGQLATEPVLRFSKEGKGYLKFKISCYRYTGVHRFDVFRCIAYGKLGEIIVKNVVKGQTLAVNGYLIMKENVVNNVKVDIVEIVVTAIDLCTAAKTSVTEEEWKRIELLGTKTKEL